MFYITYTHDDLFILKQRIIEQVEIMELSEELEAKAKKAKKAGGNVFVLILTIYCSLGYMWANDVGYLAGLGSLYNYAESEVGWLKAGIGALLFSSPALIFLKHYDIKHRTLKKMASRHRKLELELKSEKWESELRACERKLLRGEELEHERALRDIRNS